MDTAKDRAGLLWLAGLCSLGLVVIALVAVYHGITADAATIVGVIAGGLVAFAKDIVAAIRGYSMSAQLGKVTDQLAASAPSGSTEEPAPKDAIDGAQAATDAAQQATDDLK